MDRLNSALLFSGGSQQYWHALAGTASTESATAIAVDPSLSVYVGSSTGVIACYDRFGTLQWQRRVIGAGSAKGMFARSDALYIAFQEKIVKYSYDGVLQWSRYIGINYSFFGMAGLYSGSTGFYVAFNDNSSGPDAISILKINSSGSLVWQKRLSDTLYAADGFFTYSGVAVGSDDSLFLTGRSSSPSTPSLLAAKLSPGGSLLWIKAYTNVTGVAVAVDQSGSSYFLGDTSSNGDVVLIKLNSSGTQTFQYRFGGSSTVENAIDIAIDSRGTPLFIANSGSFAYLVKLVLAQSSMEWQKTIDFAGTGNTRFYSAALDAQDNIYIAGDTDVSSLSQGLYDMATIKLPTTSSPSNGIVNNLDISSGGRTFTTSTFTSSTPPFLVSTPSFTLLDAGLTDEAGTLVSTTWRR